MNIHVDFDSRFGNMTFDVEISEGELLELHKTCESVQQLNWKLYDLFKEQQEEQIKRQNKAELDVYVNLLKTPSEA